MVRYSRGQATAWWNTPVKLGGQMHYLSMRDYLAKRILAGDVLKNGKLPSERQMESGTGIARGTIREALFQLEAEGLLYRRNRSGWYVAPPPIIYDPTRWEGFMSYVTAQGRVPATETLWKRETGATAELAKIFGVAEGTPLYVLRRRRFIDARAVLIETIVVDPAMAPNLLNLCLDTSLTSILKQRYGISVDRNRIEMRPRALVASEANDLGVKSGLPSLHVLRTSYDADGRIVEYDEEYWLHNALIVQVSTSVR